MSESIDFQSYSGNWQGTSRLHDPITEQPEDSSSSLILQNAQSAADAEGDAPAALIGYTWAYQGAPQQGTLLLYVKAAKPRAQWTDTWHTGGEPMPLDTETDTANALSLLGSYAAPPGPDWGWRIVLEPGGETLQLRMDNITPDGEALPAVEATYRRS